MAIRHDCGIGLAYNTSDILLDLYTLGVWNQHRGDESAGVAMESAGQVVLFRSLGTVEDLYRQKLKGIDIVIGRNGIIHNRYSTTGDSCEENCQPIRKSGVSIGHQGNLINSEELRETWGREYPLDTQLDSEILACMCHKYENPFEAFEAANEQCNGAYNIVGIKKDGTMFIHRDPRGFHPLFIAEKGDSVYASSEDVGLQALGIFDPERIREVVPGETVVISEKRIDSWILPAQKLQRCQFEPAYFMSQGSTHKGKVVSDIRFGLGTTAWEKYGIQGDIVVPAMNSGYDYARGYSKASGISMEQALVKNTYIGRTYTMPVGKGEGSVGPLSFSRTERSRLKNVPIASKVRGRDIIVTEDSIVRRNVSRAATASLFKAGADSVHWMIIVPPIRYPCFFGMDHSKRSNLAAARAKTIEEANDLVGAALARDVGVDRRRVSVNYLGVDDLLQGLHDEGDHCVSCLTGKYYCDIPDTDRFREAFRL
jgi:amidophosphoribosyltransferase